MTHKAAIQDAKLKANLSQQTVYVYRDNNPKNPQYQWTVGAVPTLATIVSVINPIRDNY